MAVNLHRAERRTHDYIGAGSQTAETVAPGTYANTHNEPNPPPPETAVPFSSLQEKVLNPNKSTSGITPGPGAYIGQEGSEPAFVPLVNAGGVGPTSLKSKSARMAPTAPGSSVYLPSTIEKNPGPGTYGGNRHEEQLAGTTPRLRRVLRPPVKPVLEVLEKSPPSIPLRRLMPGQKPETQDDADVSREVMRHTGERGDVAGPGEYDPKGQQITHPAVPQTTFHQSKQNRKLWEPSSAIDCNLPPRENPGPGSYQVAAGMAGPAVKDQDTDEPAPNTYQFSSRSVRETHRVVNEEKAVPGPGQYEMFGYIENVAKKSKDSGVSQGERSRFGSGVDRIGWSRDLEQPFTDPYHLSHVPGPGHYPDAKSAFPDDPRKKEAEKVLPSARRKKFHGVHHPTIVMALQEASGPLHAFNSTDDRTCNKQTPQATPAPWQYNTEESTNHSMGSVLRERAKVGRKGAFGSCADRFYGSPLDGRAGLPDPGADIADNPATSGANQEPRAMFKSQSPRFHNATGPREPAANKVGNQDTPAPGAYEIEKEPNYRSPFRQPRMEHLSFGSCQQRFEGQKDIFVGHTPNLANPAPGEYDATFIEPKIKGAAAIKDKRKPPYVGCTTDVVGPGSYGSTDTSLLKRTFNVTTHTTVPIRSGSARRSQKVGGGMM